MAKKLKYIVLSENYAVNQNTPPANAADGIPCEGFTELFITFRANIASMNPDIVQVHGNIFVFFFNPSLGQWNSNLHDSTYALINFTKTPVGVLVGNWENSEFHVNIPPGATRVYLNDLIPQNEPLFCKIYAVSNEGCRIAITRRGSF